MPKRTDELVHEMPLTKTVRLKFRRIGVDYKSDDKKSEFQYELVNWPNNQGPAPILTVSVDDWEEDDKKPKRNKLKDGVEKSIDTSIMDALIAQLSSQ